MTHGFLTLLITMPFHRGYRSLRRLKLGRSNSCVVQSSKNVLGVTHNTTVLLTVCGFWAKNLSEIGTRYGVTMWSAAKCIFY